VASQTNASIDAVVEALGLRATQMVNDMFLDSKNEKHLDNLLISSALVTHTNIALLDDLFRLMKLEKNVPILGIKEKASLALGALINSYDLSDDEKISEFVDMMVKWKQNERSEDKQVVLIETLKNSGLEKALDTIKEEDLCRNRTSTCLYSLKALGDFNKQKFDQHLLNRLLYLFYDSSVSNELRLEALNLVFDKYDWISNEQNDVIFENILIQIQQEMRMKKPNKEFLFYAKRLLTDKAAKNSNLK
jgi:hypothetical protein